MTKFSDMKYERPDLDAVKAQLSSLTEQLKAEDQMRWVQMMNSIRHSAEEVILNDLIYA